MTNLRIVQLYPELLGVTGDRGNVEVLATRARFAGATVEVSGIDVGDAAPDDVDIVVIGNGPLSAMRTVREDLVARRSWLGERLSLGAPVLAVGGGAELLTDGVDLVDGGTLDGLGLLTARVSRTRERRVGYVVAETDDGRLVGFEDHASVWQLRDASLAYGRVTAGHGGIDGGFETARSGSLFATNVQGPVLPLNPQLADALLAAAFARHGAEYTTGPAHESVDAHARAARAEIERLAVSKRFNSIQL